MRRLQKIEALTLTNEVYTALKAHNEIYKEIMDSIHPII